MLFANMSAAGGVAGAADVAGAAWVDLLEPTEAERLEVERATGLRVPTRADLAEIESSSRLSEAGGVLSMSMPLATLDEEGMPRALPIGFVLSDRRLLTVRYGDLPLFRHYAAGMKGDGSVAAFLGLLEAVVDRLADVLEGIRAELDGISHRVFEPGERRRGAAAADAALRGTLRNVGRAGDRLSNIRDSLLGVQRIVQFAAARSAVMQGERGRLGVLREDVASLTDYEGQLSDKVQFLLDATLGFINIEQNNSIKILTVVSIVGVPPTLVASIYGMNFKWIPELDWSYGYFYALGMIVVTAVAPLLLFKWKGWI